MHARDPKPGGVKDPAEAAERRRQETAAISSQRKEAALRSKRLRRDASVPGLASLSAEAPAQAEQAMPEAVPEDIERRLAEAVAALREAKPVGGKEHLQAVRSLRQLLSNYAEPPFAAALAAGAVPALIAALQPSRMDATALEAEFEAAWALTNLAVGEPEVVRAVLPAAPLLIAHLGGGSGLAVAEQCAWALGNIAGEDAEHRRVLIANGAVRPLVGLLIRAARAVAAGDVATEASALTAGSTAAWALANVLRDAGHETGEFMGTEGAPEALIALLQADSPTELATEAAWVLVHLSAAPAAAHLNRMVVLGVLPPLTARLAAAAGALAADNDAGRRALTPLLRAVGNIAAGGGAAALQQLLCLDSPECAPAVLAAVDCAQCHHHGVQREACWVLASIAGAPGRAGVDALKAAGAVPVLMRLLKEAPYPVRKEAAHALANVSAGGGGGSGDVEALNSLFGGDLAAVRAMVSLMRSADADAALLGLQFTEMLLRELPSGAAEVEAADGIDALEALQFGEGAPPEMRAAAAALVDRYWGAEGIEVEA